MRDLFFGVIASLIASLVFHVALKYWPNDFLDNKLTVSIFLPVILFFALLSVLVFYLSKKRFLPKKRIFIISSSFTSAPFFSELVKNLIKKIEANNYIPVVKLPQRDFSQNELERYVNEINRDKEFYEAGILIHSNPGENHDFLKKFDLQFEKPLVFLDSKKSQLYSTFSDNCSFLGFDNEITGMLAGTSAVSYLKKHKIRNPFILVIASNHQQRRQENFISKIESSFSKRKLVLKDNGAFNRRKAYKLTYYDLKEKISSGKKIYDLIFCTNDEMALGVLHAIHDLNDAKLKSIKIIGVDGINEARSEIDKDDLLFMDTVNQNPEILAEEGVKVLFKKIRRETTKKLYPLKPEMYVSNP